MKLICENLQGVQYVIDRSPLSLVSIDGIGAEFALFTMKNSGQDGEIYAGSTATMRNIVIVIDLRSEQAQWRNRLYNFFQPRSQGTLYLYDDNVPGKKIRYYVEKVIPVVEGPIQSITVSLLCPDPKWYALEDQITELAVWVGKIEWEPNLEIVTVPFEMAVKVNTLIGNVNNPSADALGLTIRFAASGLVENPSLLDVNRQDLLKLNLTMHSGDVVLITTTEGNKRALLTSGDVTTNVSNLLQYPPVWLKAYQGDNLFRYDADGGIDNLSVSIQTTLAYWGA